MSSTNRIERRRVSCEDIQLVQNRIEQCLQLYMKPKEVVEKLLADDKIEPGFTEIVWQKLEEENPEFFRAYHLKLLVKEQITEFNKLLQKHTELSQTHGAAAASLPDNNGSCIPALPGYPKGDAFEHARAVMRPGDMQHDVYSSPHTVFSHDGSSLHSPMRAAVDMYVHEDRNMLSTLSSNMGLIQEMNAGMIKSGPGYSGWSACSFYPDGNVLAAQQTVGDRSITSFASADSKPDSTNGEILDPDISSSWDFGAEFYNP